MKKKKIIYTTTICLVILMLFCLCSGNRLLSTNSMINDKSTKKIAWGIKRAKNHEQPDFGKNNSEICAKYNVFTIGNKNSKNIYLTFDAGYEAGYTSKILDVLKENNIKAIFFVTGHYVNSAPDMIKRMIDEGHLIGNHTVNHKDLTRLKKEELNSEIMNLHTDVYSKYGVEMKYFRPPKGEFSESTVDYINSLGYTSVMWSFAYDDWNEKKQDRSDYAKKKILENLHNGEIILLHSNSKDNANILDEIIKEAQKKGYEFKSLEEFEK